MPRNGSGTYTLPEPAFVPGTVISSAAVNSNFSDLASAMTDSLPRDGQAGMLGQFTAVDGSNAAPGISFNNDTDTGFLLSATGEMSAVCGGVVAAVINGPAGWEPGTLSPNPIGKIDDYAGTSLPSGWLYPYGQAVSRTTYALLFAVLSTTYGSGDGSTTFNLPDLRGRAVFSRDDMGGVAAGRLTATTMTPSGVALGATGGAQTLLLLQANFPSLNFPTVDPGHFHTTPVNVGGSAQQGASGGNIPVNTSSSYNSDTKTTGMTVGTGGSGTAMIIMPPAMILNKIIYAGV